MNANLKELVAKIDMDLVNDLLEKLYEEMVLYNCEYNIDKTQYGNSSMTLGLNKTTLDSIISAIKETMETNNMKIINKYSYNNIKTIDLLHDNSYKTKIIDDNVILSVNMTELLPIKLNKGESEKALVDITNFRGIGKTHTLINFAKEKGYNVILPKGFIVKYVRKKYNYEYIYNEDDYILRGVKNLNCVVDEGVDIDRIKNEFGLNIITGYISKNIK